MHSLPIHLLISLFPVICFKLPITRTFFNFPRRFELSGVNWIFPPGILCTNRPPPPPPPYILLTCPERNLTIFYGIHSSICDLDSFIQSNKGSLQAKQIKNPKQIEKLNKCQHSNYPTLLVAIPLHFV